MVKGCLCLIEMQPTRGDYDRSNVAGIDALKREIVAINDADTRAERAEILADVLLQGHDGSAGYLTFGNMKISKNTGIFNMNSATDCPNAATSEDNQSETGVCQVPWKSCYAHKAENTYANALTKRRRQELLWDHMDAQTFADALLRVKERKRAPFENLRFSEAGDFRHNGDIYKVNEIARRVAGEINVYTYSASHKLSGWDDATHFTVNQSNGLADYGDRRFTALPKEAELPEGMVWCAYDVSDGEKQCGDCMICVNKKGPDVAIRQH